MRHSTENWIMGILMLLMGLYCGLKHMSMDFMYCVMISNIFASLARLEEKE